MSTTKAILFIITSFSDMGSGDHTGLWLEEFAVPYLEFTKQGYDITVASPQGGRAPVDPRSQVDAAQQLVWRTALSKLEHTVPVSTVSAEDFDAVFIPGGHGTMFDFPDNPAIGKLLARFAAENKVIASVCHGPAIFSGLKLDDGNYLVSGKRLTSFTNEEEKSAGYQSKVPFLLESRLREQGALFVAHPNWADHIEVDGKLITGQNPQSSRSAAWAVIDALSH
ncbi:MAG: type 1 glutamine amidotransferase domain-containing protein [Pseudomonadota bacterium]